jgi:hypothetical protein
MDKLRRLVSNDERRQRRDDDVGATADLIRQLGCTFCSSARTKAVSWKCGMLPCGM